MVQFSSPRLPQPSGRQGKASDDTAPVTHPTDPPDAVVHPDPVVLDGDTLTPRRVALIAREGAEARLAPEARARNDVARETLAALLALRRRALRGLDRGRSAASSTPSTPTIRPAPGWRCCAATRAARGARCPPRLVRAAMATRANQLAAGGAGVSAELLDTLVEALNAGLSPFTRELGSLGTGDLTNLADIGLCLLGEGEVWRGDELVDAGRRRCATPGSSRRCSVPATGWRS